MRPRLLDLFCGAGGAARGYQLAAFYVVGVDTKPQPRYAGDEFHLGDALTWPLEGYDAIHASPPCQRYSSAGRASSSRYGYSYPDLYLDVRSRLAESGCPWVIENVTQAPAAHGVVLCGSMFGLDIERHRCFESSFLILSPFICRHPTHSVITVTGNTPQRWQRGERVGVSRSERNEGMGIDWMVVEELTEAVPPAYTEWIGARLLEALGVREEAVAGHGGMPR